MPWAELSCQSSYSLLHGASSPEELVQTADALGLEHLALVDRDAVYGAVKAHRAAKSLGLHLIHGSTLTVEGCPALVVLAESAHGWSALSHWLTQAHHRRGKGQAAIPLESILEAPQGLSVLLRPGWKLPQAQLLREAFGERLGILLFRSLAPGDARATKVATTLAQQLKVPVVASNDVLYHEAARRRVADVLTCIRRGCTLEEAGRWLSTNAERFLLSEREVRQRFRDLPEAVNAALRFAERCTFSLDELSYRYPREVVPDGFTAIEWLRDLTEQGLEQRYGSDIPSAVRAQCEHELALIEKLDFPSYFLTVNDIVTFARSRGILCQGRGSAANSAVCYALGITAVDPSQTSLLFERFISEERGEPPDIDVDFEHERREEVIQYVYDRYGRQRAAMVNEVISFRRRSAIREVGKVMGLSLDQAGRLSKATDRWSAGGDATQDELVREAGLDPSDLGIRNTLQIAEQMVGIPRHLSIHVGGFVIADQSLVDLVPVEPASMEGRTVVQWDKYDVEALGFIKVDCLSLGMLTAIRKCFELVRAHWGHTLSLASIPQEDSGVYDMFCRADTVGVFQIESRAQMSMLPRLRPRCFYDLVIEVAIVRPGPIQGGMVHPYLRRRRGLEAISYAHPALESVLKRTLGVPLFQEQVMTMAVAVGGFSPGEADALRRAMAAWKKRGNMDGLGERLVEGMRKNGISEHYAEQIYKQIQGFGEYGFPESHAASFALLVYVSGWLKHHFPAAFTAALINSHPMGFYSPRALIADAQRHTIEVLPVCAQNSEWDCSLEKSGSTEAYAIRCGFRLVKGLSRNHATLLIQARMQGPFTSVTDCASRSHIPKASLELLAEAGAFGFIGLSRRQIAWQIQGLWTDLPLFQGLGRTEPIADLPSESAVEAVEADYRRVGFSVMQHPMELIRRAMRELYPICMLETWPTGTRVRIAGLVSNRQKPGTSNGVVFMTLEDETAMVNLVVWPAVWSEYRKIARNESILGIEGELQRQDEAMSVVVQSFWKIKREQVSIDSQSRDFH